MIEITTIITTTVELTQTFYVSKKTYEKLKEYEINELYDDEELAKEYYNILDAENIGGILEKAELVNNDDDLFSLNLVHTKK
jgi:hypothetical protein